MFSFLFFTAKLRTLTPALSQEERESDSVSTASRLGVCPRNTCATSSINVARLRCLPCAGFRITNRQPFGSGREQAPPDHSSAPSPSRCARVSGDKPSTASKSITISLAKWAKANGSSGSLSAIPAKSRSPKAHNSNCCRFSVGGRGRFRTRNYNIWSAAASRRFVLSQYRER